MFSGTDGVEYGFFCVAADTAGNIEEQDLVAETSTTIDTGAAAKTSAFALYRVKQSRGKHWFHWRPVALEDRFDAAGHAKTYWVGRAKALGVPSDVEGQGLVDPKSHLTSYRIRREWRHGRAERRKNVRVDSMFGAMVVDTRSADRLLVPSLIDLQAPIDKDALPDPFPIDHYKCYKAKLAKGWRPFKPLQVSVEDQFTRHALLNVYGPSHLCSPVDKNGEGIVHKDAHLMCFTVRGSDRKRRFSSVKSVHVANQFGRLRVDAKNVTELCVPSEVDTSEAVFPEKQNAMHQ